MPCLIRVFCALIYLMLAGGALVAQPVRVGVLAFQAKADTLAQQRLSHSDAQPAPASAQADCGNVAPP